jgi:hypothetical protein
MSSPHYSPTTAKKLQYIERLVRRAEHLRKRTENEATLSYDKAELAALDWAIATLRDIYNL